VRAAVRPLLEQRLSDQTAAGERPVEAVDLFCEQAEATGVAVCDRNRDGFAELLRNAAQLVRARWFELREQQIDGAVDVARAQGIADRARQRVDRGGRGIGRVLQIAIRFEIERHLVFGARSRIVGRSRKAGGSRSS
jgi:hypothetical protein